MDLLQQLSKIQAPSGNEALLREFIIVQTKNYVDEIHVDTLGNLILHKKGNGNKIMLTSHMDEVGFIVTMAEEEGKVRFSPIGNMQELSLVGKRVKFLSGAVGIIMSEGDEKSIKNMYIDTLGHKVNIGDTATIASDYYLNNTLATFAGLPSKACCCALIDIIRTLQCNNNDLYVVFTVQRELGSRGALTAAFNIQPDFSITIDYAKANKGSIHIGEGAAIRFKDKSIIAHNTIKNMLISAASELGEKYQIEVTSDFTGDAGSIYTSRDGVISGAIAIPVKYVNSSWDVCNVNDIKSVVNIMVKSVSNGLCL